MKQLDRLLFLQGNLCFFCQQPIPAGEASIEHIIATSNGGNKDDENCVICCRAVNAALGNLSVKAKIQALVNQRGPFSCPRTTFDYCDPGQVTPPEDSAIKSIVSDLQRRGAAKPRKTATLRNTINSIFQNKLSDVELNSLIKELQSRGFIRIQEMKVSYELP